MSHIVTIQTRVTDPEAVEAACRRLGLNHPSEGRARLFSQEVEGLLLPLPHWKYPVAIDLKTGTIAYDNFNGAWGDIAELHRFTQAYAVEKVKLEAHKKGLTVIEQPGEEGHVICRIVEA